MLKKLVFLFVIFFCDAYFSQNKEESPIDSVNKYFSISNTFLAPEKRIKYLEKVFSFANKLENDSLLIKVSSVLAAENIFIDNSEKFEKTNNVLLRVYQNKKDTTALGLYYQNKGWYFENNASKDSAYYYYNLAKKVFKESKNIRLKYTYIDLLALSLSADDYLGTELLAIEIIDNKDFETEYVALGIAYSYLGILYSKLHDFENSLKYHEKGVEVTKKIKDDKIRRVEEVNQTNNIGLMYIYKDQYDKALFYFLETLKIDPDLKNNDPEMYAIVMGNKGLCEHELGHRNKAFKSLFEGLKKAEEIKDSRSQAFILLNYAFIYKKENNLIKAKSYIDRSLALSEKVNYQKLEALELSAEIYTGKKSIEFYKRYIELKKQTEIKHQKFKNKFERVRFETEKKEEENILLKHESLINKAQIKNDKVKFLITALIAFFSILAVLFLYFFYQSRQKILVYKTNLEKAQAREQERIEIADTLHDKVVGDLRLIYERALKNKVKEIAEPLSKVNFEIRNLSHKLSSVEFNDVSFKDQIINLVSDYFAPKFKIKLKNLDKIDWSIIEPQIKRTLYLVIRESIQNSNKHAFATEVFIEFKIKLNSFQLSIKDNGKGFDISSLNFGLGLKNQKKRVEELNGKFTIESILNLGTTTHIEIPIIA